jgi:hypothetical protein
MTKFSKHFKERRKKRLVVKMERRKKVFAYPGEDELGAAARELGKSKSELNRMIKENRE